MLRRLDVKSPWRSLDRGFWPDDLPLGAKTVIYGHNGSGKSTLSELLLSLAEGAGTTAVDWEDENKRRTGINAGGVAPSPAMAVFTRKWVESNLAAFLDGKSASAIVTLGKEAIEAKDEEVRLAQEIEKLRSEASEAASQQKVVDQKVEKLTREVQENITSELKAFDYVHYTKSRYSVSKVQGLLRQYQGEFPDAEAHAEALRQLAEGAPSAISDIPDAPAAIADILAELPALLAETPTRISLQELERESANQAWVEQGLALHEERDHCLFCSGEVSRSRREQLARHFDESWLKIRSRAKSCQAAIEGERLALADWENGLPDASALSHELQPVCEEALDRIRSGVNERVAVFEAVRTALNTKVDNPSATPEVPDCTVLEATLPVAVLKQAVAEHNDQVRRHEEVTSERKKIVLDYLVGSKSGNFRLLEEQAGEWATKKVNADKAVALAERRLSEVRQAQFTTKFMADTLTKDLARVYGKAHLSVAVTPDGKSYACRRGDKPGTDLSDGERTTLSLLYFLRKLEDEQVPGHDPSQRIVVIDDPSSSLDREALFATHQWLLDTLNGFGQYIILTHDFGLLRLFVKSHKNAWGKSMKKISEGDASEARYPKVSFLEMYAASVDGKRCSKLGKMPRVLLSNTSEYAYLFSMVMNGILDSEDHERLFLLPNAARRVLEVFASYKAPHRSDFSQQLEVLVQSREGEPYRDVYDFCNRYSHGEGSESTDVLDARAVHGQIRRCMEFLRSVDTEHFERMCQATGSDASALS